MRFPLSRLTLSLVMLLGGASTLALPSGPPRSAAADIDFLFHPLTVRIGLVIPFVGAPPAYPGGDPGTGNPGTGNPGTGNPGTGNPGTGDPGTDDPGGDPGMDDPPDSGTPPSHHQPEPGTLLSALLGAGTLSWYGWRKRRRSSDEDPA